MDKTLRDEQDAWERTEGVEHKLTKIGVGGKAYYDASQIKIKRNKVLIAAARLENKQLRATLNALREKERCALGRSDLKRSQDRARDLRKSFDSLKNKVIATEFRLGNQSTNTKAAQIDCEQALDNNIPPLVTLRSLEATLDKALENLANARELKNSYEATLRPILDERTVYNSQMETLGRTSKRREEEYEQMMMMYYDAMRAREESKTTLEEMIRSKFPVGTRYHNLYFEPEVEEHIKELAKVDENIPRILEALRFPSAKELFHYTVTLRRKTDYLDFVGGELEELVEQLKSGTISAKSLHERVLRMKSKVAGEGGIEEWRPKRKAGLAETLKKMVEGTKRLMTKIHRFDARGRSASLSSVLKGSKRLVEKIHQGELYNSEDDNVRQLLLQCEEKLISWLKGFHQWLEQKKAERTGNSAHEEQLSVE